MVSSRSLATARGSRHPRQGRAGQHQRGTSRALFKPENDPHCAPGRVPLWFAKMLRACALLWFFVVGCTDLKRTSPTPDGGGGDAATRTGASHQDTAGCTPPFCQWTSSPAEQCMAASMPTQGLRPAAQEGGEPPSMAPIYLGLNRLELGADPNAATWGFDLDGQCTGIQNCAFSASCTRDSASVLPDSPYCADNTFAQLLSEAVAASPEALLRLGLADTSINCGLHAGRYNHVLRLTGYNGLPNDDDVRVDFYTSTGREDLKDDPTCEITESPSDGAVAWSASAPFRILENDLSSPMSTPAGLPNSKISSSEAFVRDSQLVAFIDRGYALKLIPGNPRAPTLQFELQRAVLVGRLEESEEGEYQLAEGAIAGRQAVADVLRTFGQLGVCDQGDFSELHDSLERYLGNYADVALDDDGSGAAPCDGVSTAMRFEARPIHPGEIEPERQVPNCCLPQNYGVLSCPVMRCGDGKVEDGERCDIAIEAGKPGACPRSCLSEDPCQELAPEGRSCQAYCAATPITAPRDGDGCCPAQATSGNDDDCSASCGNGVVEESANETCDPPGSCDTPDQCEEGSQFCATTRYLGSPDTCNARCETTEISACVNGDGCCAPACDASTDDDCSASCGDGRVDLPQETCDGNCPTECKPESGAGACQGAMLVGSAEQCSAKCILWDITRCDDADGCCPAQCNGANDTDCAPVCGNGIVEREEECDDKNADAGDGCVECRIETVNRQCHTLVDGAAGITEACLACSCEKCANEIVNCMTRGTPKDGELCGNLATCRIRSWCEFLDCYVPDGPCMSEVEATGMSNNLLTLLDRAANPTHPFGRASDVETCTRTECWQECAP